MELIVIGWDGGLQTGFSGPGREETFGIREIQRISCLADRFYGVE
jgi:hypothetical protein